MQTQLSATPPEVSPAGSDDPPGTSGQRSPLFRGPTGVRFGTVAVLGSIVAHVGLMVGLATVEPPGWLFPPPPPPRVSIAPPRVITAVPIDIALISLPAAATPAPPPASAPAAAAPPRLPAHTAPPVHRVAPAGEVPVPAPPGVDAPAISTAATTATTEVGTGTGDGGDDGPGILDMRRPAKLDLSPRAVAERANLDGGAPPPPRVRPTGELKPSGGGTYRSRQPGFTAKVDRNGEVTFEDSPSFSVNIPLIDIVPKLPRTVGRKLEGWYNDPWKDVREARRDPTQKEPLDLPGPQRPDDEDVEEIIVPIIGGQAELTDFAMRQAGMDPYAAAKRAFLERTRDERLELRKTEEKRQLDRTLVTVRKHAARAWARTDLSPTARRAALFELWDDAAEDGAPALVAAGDAARLAVIGFIHSYLPATSPDAYPAAELAALNARRTSKQPFAPY